MIMSGECLFLMMPSLFEFLILETFQAGLSWITILNKRENFRNAFDNFDYTKIATYSGCQSMLLYLQDTGIIRNKLKSQMLPLTNAHFFMEIQNEFGSFSPIYIWAYVKKNQLKTIFIKKRMFQQQRCYQIKFLKI